jgi:16S rRNA G527 N7-methylase RsmG
MANVSRETMPATTTTPDWIAYGAAHGLTVTPERSQRLDELARWLAERAFPLGLTNYATMEDVCRHALCPTFPLFRLSEVPVVGPLLDLGAGSGALGLTVALLCPDLSITMADRRRRATTFMSLTRARFHLDNVRVRQVSAEEMAKDSAAKFQVVCFRALAHADVALALAAPLLAPGGWVAVWHQSDDEGFLTPPGDWVRVTTVPTALPGLVVSRLEIVSRETIAGS